MSDDAPKFEQWAKLELMGRQVAVGLVSEATIAGGAFLRLDVPNPDGTINHTRFYSPSAVYCISPVAEDVARALVSRYAERPVQRYELPEPEEEPGEMGGE